MFQKDVRGAVIIRSGAMGAYLLDKSDVIGTWVEAFWTEANSDRVIDVTGAGNSFLGGLAAGLAKSRGDMKEGESYTYPPK